MGFKKYLDVEALHKEDVDGILIGVCHIFPKIDGTNASMWHDGEKVCFGSRNRELTQDGKDNFAFASTHRDMEKYAAFFREFPTMILYGEWLVPHTLRTYREDAWKKFYVFDVFDFEKKDYVTYDTYKGIMERYDLDYIPCIRVIENPTEEQLQTILKQNTYLIKDNEGPGEGIVIKRYGWVNKFGHHAFGKIVRNEFKEQNQKTFYKGKIQEGQRQIELEIAELYVTEGRINKIMAKMTETQPFTNKRLPEFFNRLFHEICTEDMWEIIKKNKFPTINFRVLSKMITEKSKVVVPRIIQ